MGLIFYNVPNLVDAYDPAAASVLLTQGLTFNASGKTLATEILGKVKVQRISTTTFDLTDAYRGMVLIFTHASGCVITVQKELNIGSSFICMSDTAGTVSFVAESGGTLRNADAQYALFGRYAAASLLVIANAANVAAEVVIMGRTA